MHNSLAVGAAHLALLGLDHLLDHVAADVAGVLGGQVAVVALVQGDAQLVGHLVLHVAHRLARLGNIDLVVGIVARHVE